MSLSSCHSRQDALCWRQAQGPCFSTFKALIVGVGTSPVCGRSVSSANAQQGSPTAGRESLKAPMLCHRCNVSRHASKLICAYSSNLERIKVVSSAFGTAVLPTLRGGRALADVVPVERLAEHPPRVAIRASETKLRYGTVLRAEGRELDRLPLEGCRCETTRCRGSRACTYSIGTAPRGCTDPL
jgi:hypothetical protein